MRKQFRLSLSIVVLLAVSICIQRVESQVTRLNAAIKGRVLDTDTGVPVPGVSVGSRETGWVVTDSEGRYSLREVTPGQHALSVRDWIPIYYVTQLVTVPGGMEVNGADFHVRTDGGISGRVLDENDNPISGVHVVVVLPEYGSAGELTYRVVSGSSSITLTDELGVYRLPAVHSGVRYFLLAYAPRKYENPISDSPLDPLARRPSMRATFFPNSMSLSGAVPFVLHSVEQRVLDIHMSKAPSYCIEATLKAGEERGKVKFIITEEDRFLITTRGLPDTREAGESGPDGKIRVCDLTPGPYRLAAFRFQPGTSNAPESFNTVSFNVRDADVSGIELTAQPLVTVNGAFMWDTPPVGKFDAAPVTVSVDPLPWFSLSGWRPVKASVPSEFSFEIVPGVRYGLKVSGLDPLLYVKKVTYGGVDIQHQPFVPDRGSDRLTITLGHDAGALAATVVGKDGQPTAFAWIFLVPAEVNSAAELAASLSVGLTDENGAYKRASLKPGRYYVFAPSNPPPGFPPEGRGDPNLDKSPESIEKLLKARSRGRLVEVAPNANIQTTITLMAIE